MDRSRSLRFALLLTLPTAACLAHDAPDQDVSSALEETHGGYDTADEAPAFAADAELAAAALEPDAAELDAMASDPAVISMDRAARGRGFEVVLLWGKLPAERASEAGRDWTGAFQISRGALIVRRTIAFEDPSDAVLPRVELDTVEFSSVTRSQADGLVLTVLEPSVVDPTPTTLSYIPADGSPTRVLDLSQLAAGPIVVDFRDGYKMMAIGHRRQLDPCDRGFMRGRWHALSPHGGTYLGVVSNGAGEGLGHVRGVFGQRRNGDAVLFGKFIDPVGRFRGLLVGSFADGEYRARWIDRGGRDHGTARGTYVEGGTPRAGQFLGRWAEASCAADQ